MLDFLSINMTELSQYFFDANKRIYFIYLLSALALAVPVYWLKHSRLSLLPFLRFVFPKSIYTHKSAQHDYALLVINKLIKAALFPLIVITMAPVAIGVSSAIESIFGYIDPIVLSSMTIIAIFTTLLFIFDDFTQAEVMEFEEYLVIFSGYESHRITYGGATRTEYWYKSNISNAKLSRNLNKLLETLNVSGLVQISGNTYTVKKISLRYSKPARNPRDW